MRRSSGLWRWRLAPSMQRRCASACTRCWNRLRRRSLSPPRRRRRRRPAPAPPAAASAAALPCRRRTGFWASRTRRKSRNRRSPLLQHNRRDCTEAISTRLLLSANIWLQCTKFFSLKTLALSCRSCSCRYSRSRRHGRTRRQSCSRQPAPVPGRPSRSHIPSRRCQCLRPEGPSNRRRHRSSSSSSRRHRLQHPLAGGAAAAAVGQASTPRRSRRRRLPQRASRMRGSGDLVARPASSRGCSSRNSSQYPRARHGLMRVMAARIRPRPPHSRRQHCRSNRCSHHSRCSSSSSSRGARGRGATACSCLRSRGQHTPVVTSACQAETLWWHRRPTPADHRSMPSPQRSRHPPPAASRCSASSPRCLSEARRCSRLLPARVRSGLRSTAAPHPVGATALHSCRCRRHSRSPSLLPPVLLPHRPTAWEAVPSAAAWACSSLPLRSLRACSPWPPRLSSSLGLQLLQALQRQCRSSCSRLCCKGMACRRCRRHHSSSRRTAGPHPLVLPR